MAHGHRGRDDDKSRSPTPVPGFPASLPVPLDIGLDLSTQDSLLDFPVASAAAVDLTGASSSAYLPKGGQKRAANEQPSSGILEQQDFDAMFSRACASSGLKADVVASVEASVTTICSRVSKEAYAHMDKRLSNV
jgi:hypothetical protein